MIVDKRSDFDKVWDYTFGVRVYRDYPYLLSLMTRYNIMFKGKSRCYLRTKEDIESVNLLEKQDYKLLKLIYLMDEDRYCFILAE